MLLGFFALPHMVHLRRVACVTQSTVGAAKRAFRHGMEATATYQTCAPAHPKDHEVLTLLTPLHDPRHTK